MADGWGPAAYGVAVSGSPGNAAGGAPHAAASVADCTSRADAAVLDPGDDVAIGEGDEAVLFDWEPSLDAGAELLHGRRGQDLRLQGR